MSRVDPVVSPTTPSAKLGKEKARQGQNIAGMVTVLIASIALVGIAFAVMLAFSAKPDLKQENAAPATVSMSAPASPALQQ